MLANTLKYAFFDTDTMVEMAHEKKPVGVKAARTASGVKAPMSCFCHALSQVADIFREYGQEYFRNCETEVLKQLAPYKNLVIATGGGAVLRPMNWSYMHTGAWCVT